MNGTVLADGAVELRETQDHYEEVTKMKKVRKIAADVKGVLSEVRHNWVEAENTHPRLFTA